MSQVQPQDAKAQFGDAIAQSRLVKRFMNLGGLARRPKPVVGVTPSDVIHRENKWSLLRYRPRAAGLAYKRPVLLVPSLINRHYVLDLMPGKSFAEWLVGKGHDVYIIDWGTPGAEDRYLSFDEITDKYLGRAVRKASASAGGEDVHVLGYCLGGTLTTIYTALHPEKVASLVDIAAPISFDDDGLLARWTKSDKFDVKAILDAFGNVPWQLMQATFQMLRPTLGLAKGVYMVDRAWDDEFLDGFLALESWGNDNVSFPGAAFGKYIDELYRKNSLVKGELSVSGERVDLGRIACPILNITFQHDNIVPAESAAPLMDLVSSTDKERLHLPGGHVGAVVSKSAAKGLWPKLADFWAKRDGEVARVAPTSSGPEEVAKPSVAKRTSDAPVTVMASASEPAPVNALTSAPRRARKTQNRTTNGRRSATRR